MRPSAIGPAISSELSEPHAIIVFGAGVRPDGTPSPALMRRIVAAGNAAERLPGAPVFCSGGLGDHPPAEAQVMATILSQRIDRGRLVVDDRSRDTLETVQAATRWLRDRGETRCYSCSDRYHQPRIRMLFAVHGIRSIAAGIAAVPNRHLWRRAIVRESLALPYDAVAGGWSALRGLNRR